MSDCGREIGERKGSVCESANDWTARGRAASINVTASSSMRVVGTLKWSSLSPDIVLQHEREAEALAKL